MSICWSVVLTEVEVSSIEVGCWCRFLSLLTTTTPARTGCSVSQSFAPFHSPILIFLGCQYKHQTLAYTPFVQCAIQHKYSYQLSPLNYVQSCTLRPQYLLCDSDSYQISWVVRITCDWKTGEVSGWTDVGRIVNYKKQGHATVSCWPRTR